MKKIILLFILIYQQAATAQVIEVKFRDTIDAERSDYRDFYFSSSLKLASDSASCSVYDIISTRNNTEIRMIAFKIITPINIHFTSSSKLNVHFSDGKASQFKARGAEMYYQPGEEVSFHIFINDESIDDFMSRMADEIYLQTEDADYIFTIEKQYLNNLGNLCRLLKNTDIKNLSNVPLRNHQ